MRSSRVTSSARSSLWTPSPGNTRKWRAVALFGGAPHLDRILAAYDEAWPLEPGWRERVPLHQLHLLLVHAALFGGRYRDAVMAGVSAMKS